MNIRIQNGVRTITLTKGEKAALKLALETCAELGNQNESDIARDAAEALAFVITNYAKDAPQSKPEAAKA